MNTPAPPATGLDWRAIAAGAGATLALGFSVSFLLRPVYAGGALGDGTIMAISGLVSLVADALGGVVAGILAKRSGALHGMLAMLLASACGLAVTAVMLWRMGHLQAFASLAWWLPWLLYTAIGLGVGTVAGLVAARIAAAKTAH